MWDDDDDDSTLSLWKERKEERKGYWSSYNFPLENSSRLFILAIFGGQHRSKGIIIIFKAV